MFDRLGRIQNETPFVLEWFVKNGIEVWSTKEGQQAFENDTDYFMNNIRFWQASGESKKTSLRVKTKLGQMVEEGLFTGGNCPFGYKFVKSGIITKKGRELVKLEKVPKEVGESKFTVELLNQSISATKDKIAELQEKIPIALQDYQDETKILKSLDSYYENFNSWADEFDFATPEQKKMIICKLIERIELNRGYEISIKLNMNYGQFIE